MTATGAGYDLSTTTYSPDGKVVQIEYAKNAAKLSGLALGIRCVDGVVFGVELNRTSQLLRKTSGRMIHAVTRNIGMAIAGREADGRALVNEAKDESSNYRQMIGEVIPGKVLADRLGQHLHMCTLNWWTRPYGIDALLGSYDEAGPQLYGLSPDGSCYRYLAQAIGQHQNPAKTELEKLDFKTITCEEAVKKIAQIIYKFHNDIKDKYFDVQLAWICKASNGKYQAVPKDIADAAVDEARDLKAKEQESSDSDSEEELQ